MLLDLFNDVPAFVAAAETGSFSAAGRQLGLSRSAVGKAIARIEARVGSRLFHRTTRAQTLTDEGQAFLARCTRAVAELRDGANLLERERGAVAGVLRVTMPVLYGRLCVAPRLLALADAHPALTVELDFRDHHVDIVDEGFDLAVRSGPAGSISGLASQALGRHQTFLCAAPGLIARVGEPASLRDLARYDALVYHRAGRTEAWTFPDADGLPQLVEPRSRRRFSDLGPIVDAAVAGQGVAWLPDWLVERELDTGLLQRLLPGQPTRTHDISLLWPASAYVSPRLQAAVHCLASEQT